MATVKGMKTVSDLDQERLWTEMKRMTLQIGVAEPKYTFKKLFTRPVSSQKIRVPKESHVRPQKLEDGATPDYKKLIGEYMYFNIDLGEYALATGITRNTIEDSDEEEVRYLAARTLKGMKDFQEEMVVTELGNNYLDGAVPADMVPPDYGSNGFNITHDHFAAGPISLATIDTAIANIDEHGHGANTMLCNPMNKQDLLDLLISVDLTGTANNSNAGFFDEKGTIEGKDAVTRLKGLAVITNAYVPQGTYYVFDSKIRPIAWYEKRPITVEKDPRAGYGIAGTWYSNRFGVKLVFGTGLVQIS